MVENTNTEHRITKIEMKLDTIDNKFDEIGKTLQTIVETLKEIKDVQIKQIKLESDLEHSKLNNTLLRKDIDDIYTEIETIRKNGLNLCTLHQSNFSELRMLYENYNKLIETHLQQITEKVNCVKNFVEKAQEHNKKEFDKRDKIMIGVIMLIIAELVAKVFRIL